MRALSGAIITAAALIALGLIANGIGNRYSQVIRWTQVETEGSTAPSARTVPDIQGSHIRIRDMDNGLILSLFLAGISLLIGLGITFVGLMYHHHRRYHEHLRVHGPAGSTMGHHVTS